MDQDPPVPMLRPRVKPEHAPYRVAGGKIRIGGVSFGLAAEVSDPDGWVWTMLSAMDGSRGLPEIIEHVRAAHPAQAAGVLRRGALQLLRTGYVEDVAGPVPDGLTERDMRRYDRAVGYFRWMDLIPRESSWEPQARLRDARVTILGVGGTGGVAALALAASGVGHLHCVDPDEVELLGGDRADRGAVVLVVAGGEHLVGVDRDRDAAALGALAHSPELCGS